MAEHTQGKIKAYKDGFSKDCWHIETQHSDTPRSQPYDEWGYAYSKEKADKIVLAVNNFDQMKEALETILAIEKHADSLRGSGMVDDSDQKALRAMANRSRDVLRRIEESK